MTLGEDLEHVLFSSRHHVEDLFNVSDWDFVVEKIAHGVDKDDPRPFPAQRDRESPWVKGHRETRPTRTRSSIALVLGLSEALQPRRKVERIAVRAPRRDAVTPSHRIPCCLGPLDAGSASHMRRFDVRARGSSHPNIRSPLCRTEQTADQDRSAVNGGLSQPGFDGDSDAAGLSGGEGGVFC